MRARAVWVAPLLAVCVSGLMVACASPVVRGGDPAENVLLIDGKVQAQLPDGSVVTQFTTVRGFDRLETLTRAAELVVVGRIAGQVQPAVNLERDPEDPTREHPTRRSLANRYLVEVDRYLKGEGPGQLVVRQPALITIEGLPELVVNTTQQPYRVGESYVLFLTPSTDGEYGSVGEPPAFRVEGDMASVNSALAEPREWFPDRPLDEVIRTVLDAAR